MIIAACLAAYVYSLRFPVSCKVESINIYRYKDSGTLGEDLNDIRKAINKNWTDDTSTYQYFYGSEKFDSESVASDYIRVVFYCSIKSRSLSVINQGRIIVSDIPKKDTAYVRANLPEMKFLMHPTSINETIGVAMYTKGLSEEEIESKIRDISLAFAYYINSESYAEKFTGIDSCDIAYKEWTRD